ncbi:TetR/AcrR family transcriptional regulator [Ruegeria sp. R14_0]|uniref:TetR/AcrR family transcriptional regulator n=1 Tax=Ruegeria sp. R14_0 TaxID=2821100 RepID=UPI001ADA3F53|nr:TetR/AcrR family transcriptional regulator [Ruegeria sp. R14_0]MBO9446483.1 TetR/AcrR family transcriptional regulator [Ruegeria sp. R14_0]
MTDLKEDTRQKAILDSAFQAFATYGFRKTSMDDIARGAGMSRPAVYLHFKNKEAIVAKLTELYYATKHAAVAQALSTQGSVTEILTRAIAAQTEGISTILASSHGLELLDTSVSMSGEIIAQGEADLAQLYGAWLAREEKAGRVRLHASALETGTLITTALRGLKVSVTGVEEYEARTEQFATLIGAGLEVR